MLSTSGAAADLAASLLDSNPATAEQTRAALSVLARRFIQTIIGLEVIQMRRLVIAETERFPGMGRTYYAAGPERFTATIAPWLKDRMDAGLLRPADPMLAAHHFTWLVISVPWNKALFCASDVTFTPPSSTITPTQAWKRSWPLTPRADRPCRHGRRTARCKRGPVTQTI